MSEQQVAFQYVETSTKRIRCVLNVYDPEYVDLSVQQTLSSVAMGVNEQFIDEFEKAIPKMREHLKKMAERDAANEREQHDANGEHP